MTATSGSTVLVTGANGFIGQALCAGIRKKGMAFRPVVRTNNDTDSGICAPKNIDPTTDWRVALESIHTVVHLAGRVHMVHESSRDPLRDYRLANVDATLNLAGQAAKAGVRRFIYLSSIKVNGESTTVRPFSESDAPAPADPYGISKLEAEQGLRELSQETGLEVVIIRPPLVYGPRVKANFLQLMRWVHRGIPLPLASVDNRRSMIFVDNLVDFILHCIAHKGAPGRTFLVSDDHDVSIAELVQRLSLTMGRAPKLFPVPPGMLMALSRVIGIASVTERLLNSLQVDVEQTKSVLNWFPPYSFACGIEETVRYFLEQSGPSNKR